MLPNNESELKQANTKEQEQKSWQAHRLTKLEDKWDFNPNAWRELNKPAEADDKTTSISMLPKLDKNKVFPSDCWYGFDDGNPDDGKKKKLHFKKDGSVEVVPGEPFEEAMKMAMDFLKAQGAKSITIEFHEPGTTYPNDIAAFREKLEITMRLAAEKQLTVNFDSVTEEWINKHCINEKKTLANGQTIEWGKYIYDQKNALAINQEKADALLGLLTPKAELNKQITDLEKNNKLRETKNLSEEINNRFNKIVTAGDEKGKEKDKEKPDSAKAQEIYRELDSLKKRYTAAENAINKIHGTFENQDTLINKIEPGQDQEDFIRKMSNLREKRAELRDKVLDQGEKELDDINRRINFYKNELDNLKFVGEPNQDALVEKQTTKIDEFNALSEKLKDPAEAAAKKEADDLTADKKEEKNESKLIRQKLQEARDNNSPEKANELEAKADKLETARKSAGPSA